MKNGESEDELKKLLDLYLNGRLSSGEKEGLEKHLENFRKTDDTPYEFNKQHADDVWKKITAKTGGHTNNRGRIWTWVAAVIVFTCAAVLLTLSWNHDINGLANKVILADGTIVWLKPGAKIDHSDFSKENREVILRGEALFEVAKVKEYPFVIHCGSYEARVLGTSFNIKASDSAVEVTVLTGSVRLSSLRTDSTVLVNSHEHVVLTEVSRTINKIQSDSREVESVIANTQYNMHFEDTRMEEVITRIEGKFDVYVDLADQDIGNCMISADFTDQSLPVTLSMISEALGFQYEINGNEIIISGAGCRE